MEAMIVRTEKLVFGGECLAHANGKKLFVPFALPNELLEVAVVKSYRDYDKARIVRVLEPSAHRITPACPLYGQCGGCNMQHADAAYQRELRAALLADGLLREGVPLPASGVRCLSGDDFGYRARIQLHDGSFYARESNDSVSLTHCPVATAELNAYLSAVPQKQRPRGRVQLFGDARVVTAGGKAVAANESGARGQLPYDALSHIVLERQEEARNAAPLIIGGGKRAIKSKCKKRFSGTVASEAHRCTVSLAGKQLAFDVRGFFQSNLQLLEKAIGLVCGDLHGAHALDMYSGVGTFAAFLVERFAHVTLVEHNRDALVFAAQNLASSALNAASRYESYGVTGTRWVAENAAECVRRHGAFDACVIDPPRSGMEKAVRDWLCAAKIPQLRLVSCDGATQARDIAALVAAGYRLTALYLLDFYPQTSHVESLAYLEYAYE